MEERLKQTIFDSAAFDFLKQAHPDFDAYLREKIVPIRGDIILERFGMNQEDYARVTSEVEVIINNAASVNFNERLD